MRATKFRGLKHYPQYDKWCQGDLWHNTLTGETFIKTEIGSLLVDPDTIGQFTGIKDMIGNEIYEGDLVKYKCKDEHGKMRFTEPFEIRWNDDVLGFGAWMGNEFRSIPALHNHRLRVVGNIHQQPLGYELSKEGIPPGWEERIRESIDYSISFYNKDLAKGTPGNMLWEEMTDQSGVWGVPNCFIVNDLGDKSEDDMLLFQITNPKEVSTCLSQKKRVIIKLTFIQRLKG